VVSDPYEELISAMETAILTMRKPDYFNDWKSVGFVDLAQVSDYPAALVEILPDIVADEEQPSAQMYYDNVQVRISVDVLDPNSDTENPLTAGRSKYTQCLSDLKKLFGINYHVTGACEYIEFSRAEMPAMASGDVLNSRKLYTYWTVRLYMKRTMEGA
jgi:hypothetical protein